LRAYQYLGVTKYKFAGGFKVQGIEKLPLIDAESVNSIDRFILWHASSNEGDRTRSIQIGELPKLFNFVAAVASVNGKTGSVVLSLDDLGAAPAEHNHSADSIWGLQEQIDAAIAASPHQNSGRQREFLQTDPISYREFVHDFGVEPRVQMFGLIDYDGIELDPIIRIVESNRAIAIETAFPLRYRLVLSAP
jgi:hypothetical protein